MFKAISESPTEAALQEKSSAEKLAEEFYVGQGIVPTAKFAKYIHWEQALLYDILQGFAWLFYLFPNRVIST